MPYKNLIAIFMLLVAGSAFADVWKWVDAKGQTHFVETNKAIFTWSVDGRTFYSDAPDHEDAIAVQLIWVARGSLANLEEQKSDEDDDAIPDETPEQRAAREAAEAYYCKRATEIYDAYKNAPRLYRTNDDGEREYLSEADAKVTTAESKVQMEQLCS